MTSDHLTCLAGNRLFERGSFESVGNTKCISAGTHTASQRSLLRGSAYHGYGGGVWFIGSKYVYMDERIHLGVGRLDNVRIYGNGAFLFILQLTVQQELYFMYNRGTCGFCYPNLNPKVPVMGALVLEFIASFVLLLCVCGTSDKRTYKFKSVNALRFATLIGLISYTIVSSINN